jgi:hypothetical protein
MAVLGLHGYGTALTNWHKCNDALDYSTPFSRMTLVYANELFVASPVAH